MKRWILVYLLAAAACQGQNALYLELSGEWRSSPDDRQEYARPDFDDSAWKSVSLPWTNPSARGVFWLRRQVDLPSGTDRAHLAFTVGSLAEAYEIYINGTLAAKAGGFSVAEAQVARPATHALPPVTAEGPLWIAIRVWKQFGISGNAIWRVYHLGPYALHSADKFLPVDGPSLLRAQQWRYMPELLLGGFEALLAMAILCFWFLDRRQTQLVWLALYAAVDATLNITNILFLSPDAHPWAHLWRSPLPILRAVLMAEVGMALFKLHPPWLRALLWSSGLLSMGGLIMESRAGATLPLMLMYVGIALVSVTGWIRKTASPSLWVNSIFAAAMLALALVTANRLGQPLGFSTRVNLGEFSFVHTSVISTALASVLFAIVLRQVLLDRHRLAAEVEAARTIQQVLFSDAHSEFVDAVYWPASEVGGDFWQDLPAADSQARIIAVGDVSGKGLRAAMVVSMLTGALRNRRSDSPAEILGELNRVAASAFRGGFVTATVARVEPDRVVVASAGHPPPYCEGEEIPLECGLPLGIAAEAAYVECAFPRAGNFTFVSDGVIEAANSQGELFGFDRTRAISGKSAAEIAEAARAWGQNDDITVVTVRRMH